MHRLQPGQHSFADRGAGPGGVPHCPGAAAGAAGVGERRLLVGEHPPGKVVVTIDAAGWPVVAAAIAGARRGAGPGWSNQHQQHPATGTARTVHVRPWFRRKGTRPTSTVTPQREAAPRAPGGSARGGMDTPYEPGSAVGRTDRSKSRSGTDLTEFAGTNAPVGGAGHATPRLLVVGGRAPVSLIVAENNADSRPTHWLHGLGHGPCGRSCEADRVCRLAPEPVRHRPRAYGANPTRSPAAAARAASFSGCNALRRSATGPVRLR
jgi:hypothetical protein